MLTSLTINNIVLVKQLSLDGAKGLSALTGETGAGKSILLDALGLSLGARADSKLVRHGEEQASVTACFDLNSDHPALEKLKEKDIENSDSLIIRRTITKDGKSKAFINDMPVTQQLLKEVGKELVEIHGQFETQGLLDPETHCAVIDGFAGINKEVSETRKTFSAWKKARKDLAQAATDIETARLQEEYLKYTVKELEDLNPEEGEEEVLAEKRKRLMNQDKVNEALEYVSEIIDGESGIDNLFGRLQSLIEKIDITELSETAGRAKTEIDELSYQIGSLKNNDLDESENLEEIENRYFALKDCARKHHCSVADLPKVYEELSQKLRLITHQEDALAELEQAVIKTKAEFIKLAEQLSIKRQKTAEKLSKAVNKELPDLKLDKAKFIVECTRLENENDWKASGFDKVSFLVSTNLQTPAGPINKIASGGELSRFMLALKVILAEVSSIPTLIFDEVDSGIGGATADAVGERLARLSDKYQVLVVTHSPQVASRANNHWIVAKSETKGVVTTQITPLKTLQERQEEIARMLSGAEITSEARAAAAKLMESIKHAA